MKVTAGGLRPTRLAQNIARKSDVAWFVKACAQYETRLEIMMEDGIERSAAQMRELVSCNSPNLVAR